MTDIQTIVLQVPNPETHFNTAKVLGEVKRSVQTLRAIRLGIPPTQRKAAKPVKFIDARVIDLHGDGELYRVYEETFVQVADDGSESDVRLLTLVVDPDRLPSDTETY